MGSAGRSRAEEFKGTRDRAGPPTMALEGTKGPSWDHGFVGWTRGASWDHRFVGLDTWPFMGSRVCRMDTWPFVGSRVCRTGHVALGGITGL